MENIIHGLTGWMHVIAAIVAMITGAIVLLRPKGTTWHKRIGYTYVGSMLLLNISAFMIYRLFGTFGPFHIAAVVSLASVIGGMYPAIQRTKNWLEMHYEFMGWSVIGLYAAFWSETSVRFFDMRHFWYVTVVATLLTVAVGAFILKRNKPKFLEAMSETKD